MVTRGSKFVRNPNYVAGRLFRSSGGGGRGEPRRCSRHTLTKVWEALKYPSDCTWEGSLCSQPRDADDSATLSGRMGGSVTILPVTSVELQNLFNSSLPR